MVLDTERFRLRALRETDATERYLGWFRNDAVVRHISAATTTRELSDLREYIRARQGRDDVVFLGIFDQTTGLHVGNIKYEPVDTRLGYAIMGILIGDAAYRGQGVAQEVLKASAEWLKAQRGIAQIILGVSHDNAGAIGAYERSGFVREDSPYMPGPHQGYLTMVRHQ
jgi:ribosomal-protein-alanine N-acetyltransferase